VSVRPSVAFPSVLWYCWLGLLTCKNRLPYNLYCVGGYVKHCTIQSCLVVKYYCEQCTESVMTCVTTVLICRYVERCRWHSSKLFVTSSISVLLSTVQYLMIELSAQCCLCIMPVLLFVCLHYCRVFPGTLWFPLTDVSLLWYTVFFWVNLICQPWKFSSFRRASNLRIHLNSLKKI